jgi:hypothetical protein
MPGTLGSLPRAEAIRSAAVAAAVALPLAVLGPAPGDLPAHLYRTELVEQGVFLWDAFWYGGHYPLASYSLLYYFPAALVGNEVLAVASVVVAAALFASICERRWGERARWPSRAFAVAACGPLFTGTFPYALGVAAALGSLRAFQAGRPLLGVVCAALTLGASPLAFLFLCLVLVALFLERPRATVTALLVGLALLGLGAVQAGATALFAHEARYPFFWAGELAVVLGICAVGAALALRARDGRVLAFVFGLWVLASVIAFLVPSPLGENVTRLRGVAFPLVLLAAALARFRPLWLAAPALAAALAYTLVPYVAVVPYRLDGRPAAAAYWEPALAFLRAEASVDHRVEVVPTGDHWEAFWLPHAGFPLARGWYRQLDIAQNPLFYEAPLEPEEYRAWLRTMAVRFVLLTDTQLGRVGEEREADLLRSGRSGLEPVFRSADWTIYELRDPTPLLTGPGDGAILELGHDRLAGRAGAPGSYRLRVRFTPYWAVERGDVCVEQAVDGMTTLHVRRAGSFALAVGATAERSGC